MLHGTDLAPPHSYLAPTSGHNGFEADALIHFGTYGNLEFTPGKQVALSHLIGSKVLIGSLPHRYIIAFQMLGKALSQKRRAQAEIVSYLIPPFMDEYASSIRNYFIF